MPVDWKTKRRSAAVRAHVAAHPPESGRCDTLVKRILPLAREVDESGCEALRVEPTEEFLRTVRRGARFYVVPKRPVGRPWREHWTTGVQGHCVDALAGHDGTARSEYLEMYFHYDDLLRLVPRDLPDWLDDDE